MSRLDLDALAARFRRADAPPEAGPAETPKAEHVRHSPPGEPPPVMSTKRQKRRRWRPLGSLAGPAEPAPEHPLCGLCGGRHADAHPQRRGIRAYFAETIISPEPGASRPPALGRGPAHDLAVIRDQTSAWRTGGPDLLPADAGLAELREELHAPRTYWWEEREE